MGGHGLGVYRNQATGTFCRVTQAIDNDVLYLNLAMEASETQSLTYPGALDRASMPYLEALALVFPLDWLIIAGRDFVLVRVQDRERTKVERKVSVERIDRLQSRQGWSITCRPVASFGADDFAV